MLIDITVRGPDGTDRVYEDVNVDLDPQSLTLRELEALEAVLGNEATLALADGTLGGDDGLSVAYITRVMMWIKLQSHIPGLDIDAFDAPVGALFRHMEEKAAGDVVTLPMETPDGQTTVGTPEASTAGNL